MPDREQYVPVLAPDMGLVSGVPPHLLDDRAMASVLNVRFRYGRFEKVRGFSLAATFPDPVVGVYDFSQVNGDRWWVVVTTKKVYKKSTTDSSFVDITGTPDLTGGTTHWADFAVYRGETLLITNGVDPVKKWTGTGDIANLGGSPPRASRVAVFQNHAVLADINPYVTPSRQEIRWSDLGNIENWSTGEAGNRLLLDEPSRILEIDPLRDSLLVYKEDAVYVMDYLGYPFTMGVRRLVSGIGTVASRGVVNTRDAHYVMSRDSQMYRITSSGVESVGRQVRDSVFGELAHQNAVNAFGLVNDQDGEVLFVIPTGTATTPTVAYVGRVQDEKWGRRDLVAQCGATVGLRPQSDTAWDAVGGAWDVQTITWDEARAAAGAPMMAHASGNTLYIHSPFDQDADGQAIVGDVSTKVFDLGDPVKLKRLLRLHVYYEIAPLTNLLVSVLSSHSPSGPWTTSGPYTLPLTGATNWLDLDITARFFQFQFRNGANQQPFAITGFAPIYYVREVF